MTLEELLWKPFIEAFISIIQNPANKIDQKWLLVFFGNLTEENFKTGNSLIALKDKGKAPASAAKKAAEELPLVIKNYFFRKTEIITLSGVDITKISSLLSAIKEKLDYKNPASWDPRYIEYFKLMLIPYAKMKILQEKLKESEISKDSKAEENISKKISDLNEAWPQLKIFIQVADQALGSQKAGMAENLAVGKSDQPGSTISGVGLLTLQRLYSYYASSIAIESSKMPQSQVEQETKLLANIRLCEALKFCVKLAHKKVEIFCTDRDKEALEKLLSKEEVKGLTKIVAQPIGKEVKDEEPKTLSKDQQIEVDRNRAYYSILKPILESIHYSSARKRIGLIYLYELKFSEYKKSILKVVDDYLNPENRAVAIAGYKGIGYFLYTIIHVTTTWYLQYLKGKREHLQSADIAGAGLAYHSWYEYELYLMQVLELSIARFLEKLLASLVDYAKANHPARKMIISFLNELANFFSDKMPWLQVKCYFERARLSGETFDANPEGTFTIAGKMDRELEEACKHASTNPAEGRKVRAAKLHFTIKTLILVYDADQVYLDGVIQEYKLIPDDAFELLLEDRKKILYFLEQKKNIESLSEQEINGLLDKNSLSEKLESWQDEELKKAYVLALSKRKLQITITPGAHKEILALLSSLKYTPLFRQAQKHIDLVKQHCMVEVKKPVFNVREALLTIQHACVYEEQDILSPWKADQNNLNDITHLEELLVKLSINLLFKDNLDFTKIFENFLSREQGYLQIRRSDLFIAIDIKCSLISGELEKLINQFFCVQEKVKQSGTALPKPLVNRPVALEKCEEKAALEKAHSILVLEDEDLVEVSLQDEENDNEEYSALDFSEDEGEEDNHRTADQQDDLIVVAKSQEALVESLSRIIPNPIALRLIASYEKNDFSFFSEQDKSSLNKAIESFIYRHSLRKGGVAYFKKRQEPAWANELRALLQHQNLDQIKQSIKTVEEVMSDKLTI